MSTEVIVTCAVTGAGDTVARSDRVDREDQADPPLRFH